MRVNKNCRRADMVWDTMWGSEQKAGLDAVEHEWATSSALAGKGTCCRDSEEIDGAILCQSSLDHSWTFRRQAAGDKLSPSL